MFSFCKMYIYVLQNIRRNSIKKYRKSIRIFQSLVKYDVYNFTLHNNKEEFFYYIFPKFLNFKYLNFKFFFYTEEKKMLEIHTRPPLCVVIDTSTILVFSSIWMNLLL